MSKVRVKCRVRGVALEYAGTESFFDRWVDPLLAAAARNGGPAGPGAEAEPPAQDAPPREDEESPDADTEAEARRPVPAAPTGYRPPSADFGHFVRQLGPEAAEPDRQIVAFAFFLWNYEKKEEFSEAEIRGCFRALGLTPPEQAADLYRDLAERRRFLDPGDEDGRWRLTQKGRNYVKARLLAAA